MPRTADSTAESVDPGALSPQQTSFRPRDLWRVHLRSYAPAQPYTTPEQETCFGPIHRNDGSSIPLLYASTCLSSVLWTTVFHDVPATRRARYLLDFSTFERSELRISCIRPHGRLRLARLPNSESATPEVPHEGWNQLPVLAYRESRRRVKQHYASIWAQGLSWPIPEFNETGRSCYAVVLFGDRVHEANFTVKIDRAPLCSGVVLQEILELAERSGIGGIFGM